MELQKYAIQKLSNVLNNPDLVQRVEKGIYTSSKAGFDTDKVWDFYTFRKKYRQLLQSTLENLSFEHSNLRLGLTDAKTEQEVFFLVTCDRQLLAPQLWSFETEMKDTGEDESRGLLKCSKCARKGLDAFKTEYTELQTRSSDEPMTVFCYCRQCKSRWKA